MDREQVLAGISLVADVGMHSKADKVIPSQEEGASSEIRHVVETADEHDARKLFLTARNRLVDINRWGLYSSPATFRLAGPDGFEVARTAEPGDYIKVDLPGPGSGIGRGYDWVRIEMIEDHSAPESHDEEVAIRVRPASNPQLAEGESAAHFFSEAATSSFLIRRSGNRVMAAIYGRNEKPNIDTPAVTDKIRNAAVAFAGMLGLSHVQWKSLVRGLVST